MTYLTDELQQNKKRIDAAIDSYWNQTLPGIQRMYGDASLKTVEAFADIMKRGGKRVRPALATTAYRMFGGSDPEVIIGMGLSLEMIHAYLLVIDDICDHSPLRRGGPSAHYALADWHQARQLRGNSWEFGANLATLAATIGLHEAMQIICRLPVADDRRVAALENVNRLLTVTCHGQVNDLMNEASQEHDPEQIENVLTWKTAYYTFANPLQFGAILAGAPQQMIDAFTGYSQAAGRAFQISDDILSTFGNSTETGKHNADDIKEGKRTLLTVNALRMAAPDDAAFLESCLGNAELTDEDFVRAQRTIRDCGALQAAQIELERSCQDAIRRIQQSDLPEGDGIRLLCDLAAYLKDRTA